jgi:hypothetical protein
MSVPTTGLSPGAAFSKLLPIVRAAAWRRFRQVPCPDRRADLLAEAVALAFSWFVRLHRRGKDPAAFIGTLAELAARAVSCGRRLAGQEPARDVLSFAAGRAGGFHIVRLGGGGALSPELEKALAGNARTPVPDQVSFRLDVPRWVRGLPPAKRRAVGLLAVGHGTAEVAGRLGVTPARVSQLRGELKASYLAFLSDGRTPTPAG